MKLHDLGEDELIRRLLALVPRCEIAGQGPGDDCAVLDHDGSEGLLLKTDSLVEGVHYRSGELGVRVGWKAVARVVSDFAAAGGRPSEFLISLAASGTVAVGWLEDLYRGMARCMEVYGGTVVGGETSSVPEGAPMVITISAVGRVKKGGEVLRSGGRAGDLLVVTGRLGGSLAGAHLDFMPRLGESSWLVDHGYPVAMMDLSDGLAKDLPRLAAASGCGFRLDRASIPCHSGCSIEDALGDGEDYELLFAVRSGDWPILREEWREAFPSLELTMIGQLVEKKQSDWLQGGWDHFS